jgi:hypothetical protein
MSLVVDVTTRRGQGRCTDVVWIEENGGAVRHYPRIHTDLHGYFSLAPPEGQSQALSIGSHRHLPDRCIPFRSTDFKSAGAYHHFFPPPAVQGGLDMEFQFRSEIRDFIAASETILSPTHLVPPMTVEEKQLVLVYVTELAVRCKED